MTTRKYSSRSQQTTLAANLTDSATSCTVVSGSALLGGASVSAGTTFTVVIDPDTALEEIVDVTVVSTNVLTITRGVENAGTGQAHSAGAAVRHMAIGRDFREANLHIEATGGYNDGTGAHTMHGIAAGEGVVVGTDKVQTLTQKTLTSPTITNPSISGAGVDASIVFEGATPDAFETTLTVVDPTQDNTITLPNTTGTVVIANAAQTLTNKTIDMTGVTLTGLSSAGMTTSSATPKDYVDSILGSATAAATSAASAATSAASAATSAGSSETSAIASAASAATSASSATAAATSATSAAASATAAATSATSAAASATTAANSVATIAASATAAATSATSAATSASSAATSATASANSATASASSASASATSATASASSASAAATSASSAATSATAAATSATSAAASAATAAAAVAASFDAKGDLLVGTGASAFDQLTVAATNGYVLSVNNATATGLEWAAANPGDITGVTAGTGLTGGGTSGTVTLNVDTTTIQARVANVTDTEIGYLDGVTSAIQTQLDAKVSTAGGSVISANTSSTALEIRQTGAGKALVVEDSTNPDSSSFVIASDGKVTVGSTAGLAGQVATEGSVTVSTNSASGSQFIGRKSFDGAGNTANLVLARSRGTNESPVIVQNGDLIGNIIYTAYDGSNYLSVATITAGIDATPGTNDMPGFLVFGTTADGAGSQSERMRINSSGNVGIGTASPTAKLDVNGSIKSDNLSGENVIINGGMDIAQRGATFTSVNSVYTLDRWFYASYGTSTTANVSQGTTDSVTGFQYYAKIAANSATNANFNFGQTIETANTVPLRGKTVTVSFYLRAPIAFTNVFTYSLRYSTSTDVKIGNAGTGTLIGSEQTFTPTTSWTRYSATFTIPTDASSLGFILGTYNNIVATANFDVTGVQLEIGSVATPFSRAGGTIAGELAACQRYYWRNNAASTYQPFGVGTCTTTTNAQIVIYNPVPMRAAPTSIDYSSLVVSDIRTYNAAVTAVTFSFNGTLSSEVAFVIASGGVVDRPTFIRANNSTSAYLAINAEL